MAEKEEFEDFIQSSAFYKDRDDWKDVVPIYNSAAEDAVVRIAHSDAFVDAFAYFRAILHKNELSDRAFELTTSCTQLNPANYSVWQFRRNILRALKKDLNEEFRFSQEMANENPKNYQVWHHRRVLVEWTEDPSREMQFTEDVLDADAKNYHAWQHRQWVVEKFGLFSEKERAYSTRLLLADLRNNSAWNYRYFILNTLSNSFRDVEIVNQEIEFTKRAIEKLSKNESSWSYLTGLLVNEGLATRPDVLAFCEELHDNRADPSPHLRCVLFDYQLDQLLHDRAHTEKHASKALKLLEELEELDSTRHNYWQYLRSRVENLQAEQS